MCISNINNMEFRLLATLPVAVCLTIPDIFSALELVFLLLLKRVCMLAMHMTQKSINSLHLEMNQ